MSRQYVLGMPAVPRSRPALPWSYSEAGNNPAGVYFPNPSQIYGMDEEVGRLAKLRLASKDPDTYLQNRENAIKALKDKVNAQYAADYNDLVRGREIPEAQAQELALAKAATEIQVGMAVINAQYPETFGTHNVEEAAWRSQAPRAPQAPQVPQAPQRP
jgi:hypothetical protein